MNWGGFAGGFSQGFGNGVSMGKTIRDVMKQSKLEDLRAQGMAEANSAREAEIDGKVKENTAYQDAAAPAVSTAPLTEKDPVQVGAVPAASGIEARPLDAPVPAESKAPAQSGLTGQPAANPASQPASNPLVDAGQPSAVPASDGLPQMRFAVDGKGYNTREEARAAAQKSAPPVTDYFYKTVYPKMVEAHVANGDLDQAEKIQTFIKSKRGEKAVEAFGGSLSKLMMGDDEGGAKDFAAYANNFLGIKAQFAGKAEGGLKFSIEGADGKAQDMVMTPTQLMRMGMAYDPAKTVDMMMKQVETKEKTAAEVAKESRAEARDIRKEDRHQAGQIELKTLDKQLDAANVGTKARAEVRSKVAILKEYGKTDEEIQAMLPSILRLNEHKKVTEPTERRALVVSDLTKNDPTFARKPAAEQNKAVDQMMTVIYGGEGQATPKSPAAATTPAAGGLPKPKGIPVFDTKTQSIIYK